MVNRGAHQVLGGITTNDQVSVQGGINRAESKAYQASSRRRRKLITYTAALSVLALRAGMLARGGALAVHDGRTLSSTATSPTGPGPGALGVRLDKLFNAAGEESPVLPAMRRGGRA